MRKQIIQSNPSSSPSLGNELDLNVLATVQVTSEQSDHPIENAFDNQRGPGGSRWVAGTRGEQTVILAFDTPQRVHEVTIEIEETHQARTQELQLAISCDGGNTYHELLRQEYMFSPSGATFERETWAIKTESITHLRLHILPHKGGGESHASLTSLVLR